jgi:AraC-like DNA-binding protein
VDAGGRKALQMDGDHLCAMGLVWGTARCFVSPESALTVAHMRLAQRVHAEFETVTDTLLVKAHANCSTRYNFNNDVAWDFRRPSLTVSFIPRGARVTMTMEPDVMQKAVILAMNPCSVLRRFAIAADVLPTPLREIVEGGQPGLASQLTLPLRSDISSLVDDLTGSRLHGSLRALQAEARCSELFALVISAWKEHLDVGHDARAQARDTEIVAAARRILTERYANPPTVRALASQLGTNKTKLNRLFQEATGVTPRTYWLQQRIERAESLLTEGRLNLAQIAEAVGYQHQSSFTAAFCNALGMCPREYRRNAALHRQSSTN